MGLHFQDGLAWDAPAKRWRIRVQVAGRVRKGSAPSKPAAIALRDNLLVQRAALRLGVPVPEGRPIPPSLAEVFAGYVAELRRFGKSPRSVAQVESIAALWRQALGPAQTGALSREDFGRFVEWCGVHTESKGAQTRTAMSIAKTALRVAGLPVPPTPVVRVERASRRTAPAEKLRAFLAALEPGTVARVAAELVVRTGCRETEARSLRIGDVDLAAGVIRFRTRKGSAAGENEAPISPGLRSHLEPWLAGPCRGLPPEAPLLAVWSRRGAAPRARHPLTAWSLQSTLSAAARDAEIGREVRGLGWLRNQAATLAGDTGAEIETLRRALGHTTSAVTERHYDQSRRWGARVELGDRVDSVLDGPGTPAVSGHGGAGARVRFGKRESGGGAGKGEVPRGAEGPTCAPAERRD